MRYRVPSRFRRTVHTTVLIRRRTINVREHTQTDCAVYMHLITGRSLCLINQPAVLSTGCKDHISIQSHFALQLTYC